MNLTNGLGPCGDLIVVPEGADDGVAACVLGNTEVLGEDQTPAALYLGDEVCVNGLVGSTVGVAHMRRHSADNKAILEFKIADFAGLKNFG